MGQWAKASEGEMLIAITLFGIWSELLQIRRELTDDADTHRKIDTFLKHLLDQSNHLTAKLTEE